MYSVGRAEAIVLGRPGEDHEFQISETLFGEPVTAKIKPGSLQRLTKQLSHSLGAVARPELLLFLSRRHKETPLEAWEDTTLAVDAGGFVWGWLESFGMMGHQLQKCHGLTRENLLKLVRQKVDLIRDLRKTLALPRSAARALQLVQFLRDNREDVVGNPHFANTSFVVGRHPGWLAGVRLRDRSYLLKSIGDGLRGVSVEEAEAFLESTESADNDVERAMFLNVLKEAPAPLQVFDRLKTWAHERHGDLVRWQAFAALTSCDYEKGVDALIPLLVLSERQLMDVLSALGRDPERPAWPKQMVPPLRTLGIQALSAFTKTPAADENHNVSSHILYYLNYLAHPLFVPVLREWAESKSYRGVTTRNLCSMLGFPGETDLSQILDWLTRNEVHLTREYELQADPRGWMRVYQSADDHLKPMLLRLWRFEAEVDAERLLREATNGPFPEEAKAVLSYLWDHKRLSWQMQRKIVERFVSFTIEAKIIPNRYPDRRVYVSVRKAFPFPRDAWLRWDMRATVDAPAPQDFPNNEENQVSFDANRPSVCVFDVRNPDVQKAHILVRCREGSFDILPDDRWSVLWRLDWPAAKQ